MLKMCVYRVWITGSITPEQAARAGRAVPGGQLQRAGARRPGIEGLQGLVERAALPQGKQQGQGGPCLAASSSALVPSARSADAKMLPYSALPPPPARAASRAMLHAAAVAYGAACTLDLQTAHAADTFNCITKAARPAMRLAAAAAHGAARAPKAGMHKWQTARTTWACMGVSQRGAPVRGWRPRAGAASALGRPLHKRSA